MCRLYGKGTKVSLEKYIKIVERVNIDDPGSYKVPEPIRNLGDGFETVNHNGQKGVRDTQTGKLILISNKVPDTFNITVVQDGQERTQYGLRWEELGPATQKALRQIGAGWVQETYESSKQVRSIVQRMMEDARVPQKPRQGPLRPQTGAGKHKDKKKDQKQGKEKHKKPFMEQGVAEADYSPMTKDSMKADKIRSLKNLIAKYKEQGRQLKVQELELELKKLQGVAETSDYFRRREREEAIIGGQKPARKKQPAQTSDYARRREQEKKAEKGVAEGRRDRDGGWDGTMGWEERNPLYSREEEPQPRAQTRDDDEPKMSLADLAKKQMRDQEGKPKVKRDPPGTKSLGGGFKVHFEAIQRDLKLPDSYYLQLSSGAKSDLKNLYINYILESVNGVKKDTLETVSYPELKNIVRMIEEKQKGVDGKACWKGYKRMGTKKKGRRTVDNCVKAESLQEKSPPGFKGTVKAMKKHPELTKGKTKDGKEKNPWALAWHMKNKGYKSHKKADGSDKD